MPLVNEKGEQIKAGNEAAKSASDDGQEPDLSKPMLGIDKTGNMTLFIPLAKTGEVLTRGLIDVCRTEVIKWYVQNNQKQQEIAALATKTGFQRFKQKLSNITGK